MSKHLYNVGDVLNGLIITEQCYKVKKEGRKKGYKYKCLKCGYDCGEYYKGGAHYYEHIIMENNLKKGAGCAVCSKNGFVVPTINSIHVLRPDVECFLVNKNDAFKYAPRSSKKLKCKCVYCEREYLRSCDKLCSYGVPCICGDGFSYPEKFMFSALTQLNIRFKPQYYFNGSLLRYDFYLNDYKVVIEVNGEQHYKQKWDRNEIVNDIKKKEFALSQGIIEENYITIDCRESNMEFIKRSILNSKINQLFDCDEIDFNQCAEFASHNLMMVASNLWNNGKNIQDISQEMQLDKHTIIAYLKQGNNIGWCVYQRGDGVRRYNEKRKINAINSSGVTGVTWRKSCDKWQVRISVRGDRISVGLFDNIDDAIVARLKAEWKYFGEDAPQIYLFNQYNIIEGEL